jgi:tyrosine ammonia-lyase
MIELGPGAHLSIDELEAVARHRATVSVSAAAWEAIERSHAFMRREAEKGRRIYGVTTGFGPLADHYLHPHDAGLLQQKLVYHLATGVGEPFAQDVTRAMMLARLSALARGFSAVDPAAVDLLVACVNADLVPVVPSLGTVGASGDLTPLAHIALALMGEGDFWEGSLAAAGLSPLKPTSREALGLVNGTSAMTGLAALNGADAVRAWEIGLRLAVANAEVFGADRSAFHTLVGEVRPHEGQRETLQVIGDLLAGSGLEEVSARLDLEALSSGPRGGNRLAQDPYTIRCIPQVFGAIRDQISSHNACVETELNSVTDNPLFDAASETIVHGGNFMGQHVSFVSDALNNAMVMLGVHAERVVARLVDSSRNGGLPPFLNGGRAGLDSGFMGAQVTASALVAQMRTHAHPASVQSISTNADNQDVVSMGTIAALRTHQTMARLFELLSIEAMVVVQAMEQSERGFGKASSQLREDVREVVPALDEDRPLSAEIGVLAGRLRDSKANK